MSINTKSATAIVRFTGLGILCFNPRRKRVENLFIHEANHVLTVDIFKPCSAADNLKLMNTNPNDVPMQNQQFSGYWYRQIIHYSNMDQSQVNDTLDEIGLSIDVCGIGNPEIDGYKRYEPGSFDRLDTGDDVDYKDFRWMVNIQRDGIFGDGPLTPVAAIDIPSTKLFIRNAEFYTAAIAKEPEKTDDETGEMLPRQDMVFKKLPLVHKNAEESARIAAAESATDFGRMGSDIGAAINADRVRIRIAVGDEEHIHMLPRITRPYVVFIKNNATTAASDIPIYQKFWEGTGEVFDLLTAPEIVKQKTGGRSVSAREMCNGVVVEEPESVPPFN